jgi:amino acid transporter
LLLYIKYTSSIIPALSSTPPVWHGLFPGATGAAHADNETPHIADTLMSLIAFAVPYDMVVRHDVALLDAFNYVGTLAAFGVIVPYMVISIAAPAYLKQLGARKPRHLLVLGASLALLLVPAVGSVYPVPPAPLQYFPYSFLTYLVAGIIWILALHRRKPEASTAILRDLGLARADQRAV